VKLSTGWTVLLQPTLETDRPRGLYVGLMYLLQRQIEVLTLLLDVESVELDDLIEKLVQYRGLLSRPRRALIRDLNYLIELEQWNLRSWMIVGTVSALIFNGRRRFRSRPCSTD